MNAKDRCRLRALLCLERAQRARDRAEQTRLLDSARAWLERSDRIDGQADGETRAEAGTGLPSAA